MKRLVIFMIFVLCVMPTGSVAMASYPQYLGGDENYILCDGHMGVGFYVDKSSLNVEEYNPPHYIIAIDVVSVQDADRGNTEIHKTTTRHYYYNWDERAIYLQTKDGEWKYLDPQGSRASGASRVKAGKIAFELAYGVEFDAR